MNLRNSGDKGDLKISKTMCYILRHNPGEFNLAMDIEGRVNLEKLTEAINRNMKINISKDRIEKIVKEDNKQRYAIQEDSIRAVYGHSFKEKINKESEEPPRVLYHGTPKHTGDIILGEGLKPMKRQYVHLTEDIKEAEEVGRRRSKDVVIIGIRALDASREGVKFYKESKGIWLSDTIAGKWLTKIK